MTTKMTLSEHKIEGGFIINAANNSTLAPPVEQSVRLNQRLDRTRQTYGYRAALFKETFSDELWQAMEHRGLNQAQFAAKADVPKQFLTKVFKGGNCTIDTIVKLAHALDYKADIHLTPNDFGCGWIHCIPQSPDRIDAYIGYSGHSYSDVIDSEKEMKSCNCLP